MVFILYTRTAFLRKSNETIQLYRLSTNTLEKSSSNGIKIEIPKYINRSSTDILKVNIIHFGFGMSSTNLGTQLPEYLMKNKKH